MTVLGHQGGASCARCGCHASGWLKGAMIAVFALGGGYYLWSQHQAHVLQYWPLAIFLLCQLMHLFGGHGRHGGANPIQLGASQSGGRVDASR